ncbi:hypothetical protein FA592_04120 [Sulfurospirillum diekertiae]|uniref:Uncharacterized protein n=1 Tax=Sulfurospirillum diekertiae TaxID=1854492 RepID=A0A6G9VQ14_9BACT|nr:hypothetical protein [Sulfurospirillum diekertiae]QIR75451.1 hypothetical protein FA584_04225 [Sulfurospirillum diekertiae]QIR78099.1 hypothetical protein FA592_04120 [Sulfurospirillum diekertiae]
MTIYRILSFSVLIVYLAFVYIYQLNYPPRWDALSYLEIAKSYFENGIFYPTQYSITRLYGYPLFLSLFYQIFEESIIREAVIFVQLLLYFSLSIAISNIVGIKYPQFTKYIQVGLFSNIFLFPYLMMSASDGFSIIIWLSIIYTMMKILLLIQKKIDTLYFFIFGFLVGYSIMIRPANIHIIILIPVLIVSYCYFRYKDGIKNNYLAIGAFCFLGFFVAVVPQIYINYTYFDIVSFLPARNLGSEQINWGIQYLKAAANCTNIGTGALLYTNPLFKPSDILGLEWYWINPIAGLKTIGLHIFSAFDYNYLFPYIYNINPKYSIFLFFYSQVILYFGVIGYGSSLKYCNSENAIREFNVMLFIMIPLVVLGSLSVIAISAVENRFSLPIITILLPFAFFTLYKYKTNKLVILGFTLYLIMAFYVSSFINAQKTIF